MRTASAWTARWPPAPATSANTRRAVARIYESLETCPDDLLLFLHHVPYTHKLHSGKTVIQYIYDSHYEGADAVEGYVRQWKSLRGLVDEQRYNAGAGAAAISGWPGRGVARRGDRMVPADVEDPRCQRAAWDITPAASRRRR